MKYEGTATARGIAIGKALLYAPYVPEIPQEELAENEVQAEKDKYNRAYAQAVSELKETIRRLSAQNPGQAEIFQAHLDILEDETISEEILDAISGRTNSCKAVDDTYAQYAEILAASDDPLFAERAADMMDVRLRVIRCLNGVKEMNLADLPEPVILIVHDLLPSDTATLSSGSVHAIVSETGGLTSHSAIIARSYGIPAISGIQNVCELVKDGESVIVDALKGLLITDPSRDEINAYEAAREDFKKKLEDERKYLRAEPITAEGEKISVLVNIGKADEREFESAGYVNGVGLFRTEFLYMGRKELPTEDEQFEHYKKVFEAFAPNPVTIRTLDIGGDKEVECLNLPKEDNPFLGNRALRFCLEREDLFLTQLRAILRASVYGKVKIMFPMVGSIEDIRAAKNVVEKAKQQLDSAGIPWNHDIQVGTMIEIPSIAIIADLLAKEVDFASIGTNDLTQYTLATDRVNPSVSKYYQPLNPAVLRLLRNAIVEFNKAGKGISVCGEMGGDPASAAALLGMGIKSLSMGASSVAAIKKLVCTIDMEKARRCVDSVCNMDSPSLIRKELDSLIV